MSRKVVPTSLTLRPPSGHPLPRERGLGFGAVSGFALLELIMVLLITSIALAVGVIRLGRLSVFMTQGERAAHVLVADLRFAQSEAITQAKNHCLLFTSDGSRYTSYAIYRVETGGDVLVEPPRVLPASVSLTGLQPRAEFRPGGDAAASYSYTVTSPGHSYQIGVVLVTGGVSIQGS
jgi:type II secretory pathway pseudopilin PulG